MESCCFIYTPGIAPDTFQTYIHYGNFFGKETLTSIFVEESFNSNQYDVQACWMPNFMFLCQSVKKVGFFLVRMFCWCAFLPHAHVMMCYDTSVSTNLPVIDTFHLAETWMLKLYLGFFHHFFYHQNEWG